MTSTEQNTIAFSIANPTVCISNMAQYYTSKDWLEASQGNDALWGNPSDMKGTRTTPIPTRAANRIMTPALQATGYRSRCIQELHVQRRLHREFRQCRRLRHKRRRADRRRRLQLRLDVQYGVRTLVLPRGGTLRRKLRNALRLGKRPLGLILEQLPLICHRQWRARPCMPVVQQAGPGLYILSLGRRKQGRRIFGTLHKGVSFLDSA